MADEKQIVPAQIQNLLSDVEKIDGAPVVISHYGFRVETINGKKYLVAMSRDDLAHFTKDEKVLSDGCLTYSNGLCSNISCSGICAPNTPHPTDPYFKCVCG